MRKPSVLLQLLLGLVVMSLFTGCSAFQRDWRKAARQPHSGIAGRWEGSWRSDSPGHDGRLRCLLTPIAPDQYEARFHAKYKKILGFGYTAAFTGRTTNGVFAFSGQADLGKLAGGIYHYEGRISLEDFFSTYKSKYDRGTFQLQRPR